MASEIAWAIDSEGAYRHIREVPNGKACGCRCLHCGEPLIACHPKVISDYFSHYSGSVCSGESVLHKLAKKILEELAYQQYSIRLPAYYVKASVDDLLGNSLHSVHNQPMPTWVMQSVASECNFRTVIVDSLATNPKEEKLGIEIFVRHKKSDEDSLKFEKLPFEVMEIDLSEMPWDIEREDLQKLLLNTAERRWLNSCGHLRIKVAVEQKLQQLLIDRNRTILSEFNKLKEETLANSFRYSTRVKNLRSPTILLSDGTEFFLEKRISVKNIRSVSNDLFGASDDYVADIIVDGAQDKKLTIKVIFTLSQECVPVLRLPNVLFRLTFDDLSKTFSFEPELRYVKRWQRKLNVLASSEAKTRNCTILEVIQKTE